MTPVELLAFYHCFIDKMTITPLAPAPPPQIFQMNDGAERSDVAFNVQHLCMLLLIDIVDPLFVRTTTYKPTNPQTQQPTTQQPEI